MASLLDIAGKILDAIVVRKVEDHVGYIFRYKRNIKELEFEKKRLEEMMIKNKKKVEEANIRNDIVEEEVEEWAKKAEDKKHEVENLMVDKARDENVKCIKFFCPNLCSRYRISKEAVQKKGDIEGYIRRGNFEVVAHSRPPPSELQFTSTRNFMNFDSREPLLKLIKDKLKSGDPKYNMIGVHGVGGIGKTTAVEQVGKQLKEEGVFYDVVKGVVSRDVNVCQIQGQLADQLGLRLVSETEMGRRGVLWNRLNNGKNNLVILDDLWGEVKLTDIGIPLREGKKGCKVVLTTRDRKVLTDMEVGEYIPVEVLSEEEAWALFEKKVGVTFDYAKFYNVAESVCKECQGLPVAILAVGGALAGIKDVRIWKEVLDQLQNSSWENIDGIDRKMYASLRWSYDYLGRTLTEAKLILLLCCLYPEDNNIPVDFLLFHCIARRMLPDKNTMDKARNRIIILVSSLKDRSLLLDGKDKDHVKMHDVIRDVVISIAKTDEQYLVKNVTDFWPIESINENMAAISVCLNELKEVPNEPVCPRLHTLRIECKDSSFQFSDNFFSGVGEIIVLELKGIRLSSTPSSLANLYKLRTLILIDCQLEDISFLKGLKSNLVVLVIEDSDTKALPMELGELSHLRVLLLDNCYRLKLIPAGVIPKLTHLEELCLPDKFNFCEEFSGRELEDIEISRATLSELSSLTRVTNLCVFIPNVTLIPDFNFGKLISYRIAVGEHFNEAEKYFKERNLKLECITYHNKIVALLERVEVLYLYNVNGLKNVLLNKEGKWFLELEHFFIKYCHDLEQLLGTPDRYTRNQGLYQSISFSKLTALEVSDCSFKFLFTSTCAKGLQQLKKLDIRDCDILEVIVGTEGEKDEQEHFNDRVHFSKLKYLRLSNLPKLIGFGPKIKKNATAEGDSLPKGQSLFNEKVAFPSLEILSIINCSSISDIWDKHVLPKESFPQMVHFYVCSCEKLINVFSSNMFTLLQNLKHIEVRHCKQVEFIVSNAGVEGENNETVIFPYLEEVRLINLDNLKSFCGSSSTTESNYLFNPQVIFPALERLEIWSLSNITEIWDKQVLPTKSFPYLADVEVYDCEKLVTVFPSNLWAQSLRSVSVIACKGVTVVVSITGPEESEDANNCSIIFPQLSYVELSDSENLNVFCGNPTVSKPQSLFNPQIIFPALKDLHIESLPNITEIWDKQVHPTKSFPHLADVWIWNCEKLVTVFPSNLWAESLRKVSVRDCKGVTVVVSITGLEESEDASNCSIIFPLLSSVKLTKLENLNAFCGNSTCLFDPRVIFPALEYLYIKSLPNITEIWDKQIHPTRSLPHMHHVRVVDCEKLVTVFPSNLWVQSLREVVVRDCKGVTVVVSITGLEQSEDTNNYSIIFPVLSSVDLIDLENLNAFCGNSTGSKPQSLFDPQVHFPALETITLVDLPNIEIFKQQLSKGEVKFPVICDLVIGNEIWYYCGKPNMNYLAPQVLE